jgi:predicted DNA-binding transcriptional regulator AlpA
MTTTQLQQEDPLLTTREVGELLAISPEAVLKRWRAGDLPGFRLSSKVLRFRQSEIVEWLEEHREGPVSGSTRLRALP